MKKIILIIALGCILAGADITIAGNHYTINHYTADNGLPQNSVKSIAADSKGFVWLATEDGLARFDGQHFFIFNKGNLHLTGNGWLTIHPSKRFHPKSRGPVCDEHSAVSYATFGEREAIRIEGGSAIRDLGYYADWDRKMRRIISRPETVFLSVGLPNLWANHSTARRYLVPEGGADGSFFLCDSSHVSWYEQWKKKHQTAFTTTRLWNYFSVRGKLYYWNGHNGFTEIMKNGIVKRRISGDILKDADYQAGKEKIQLFWNNNSGQAFLNIDKCLYTLEQQTDGSLTTRLLLSDFDFSAKSIQVIFYDRRAETIYLGSSIEGLYVLSKRQFETITIKGENSSNIFYAQLPFSQNTILTPTGQLVGKNAVTNQSVDSALPALQKINLSDKRVIIRGKAGKIWIKAYKKLFCLDPAGKKVLGKWSFPNEIKALYSGNGGYLWMGEKQRGLYRLDPALPAGRPEPFAMDSLKNITCIASLSDQLLLVGTMAGLFKVHLKRKKIEPVLAAKDLYIKSILVAGKGCAWIAIQEKGLCLLDKDDRLLMFPLDKNRFLASPHCVVDDGRGYLWVPTNRGLFQMALRDLRDYMAIKLNGTKKTVLTQPTRRLPAELFYLYHAKDEGFLTNEFNGGCQPCAAALDNGYISLPSLRGLVWFRPEKINTHLPEFDIILDKAEVNQMTIPAMHDTVRLPLNPQNIKLYFATAHFGNAYNLNLSYALLEKDHVSQDPNWLPLDGRDVSISYSSLKSGEYTLLIRKLNGFGIDNYLIKKLHLIVPKNWYETPWAIFLFIACFNLVLVLFIHYFNAYKLRSIQQENARLDSMVMMRTTNLNRALKELEVSKNQMSQQIHLFSRLLASITHDVQSPLKFVVYASESITRATAGTQTHDIGHLSAIITDLSGRMSTMLQDLTEYIKIQVYGNNFRFESINLKTLVDTKLDFFKDVITNNRSDLTNQIQETVYVVSDYQLLSIIIHNLIDNAAKYTHHGKISIYCRMQKHRGVELVISNTGSGLSASVIENLNNFRPDRQSEQNVNNKRVTGLGLIIVRELCDLLGVTLRVTQTASTNFHLFFQ